MKTLIRCAVGLLFASLLQAKDGPPNVVLILADDLGWGEVGVYGQKKI